METKSDITPPPNRRDPRHTTSKRGGGLGALEASRDLEPGQVASRAVPVPGPMAELAVQAAMVDLGTRAAMVDQGTQAAMADQGTQVALADQAAMVDQGTPWAMVGRAQAAMAGSPWAMASPGPPWAMVGSPPKKKNYWGDYGSTGGTLEARKER